VQNAELLTAKAGVASSNHYVLNESSTVFSFQRICLLSIAYPNVVIPEAWSQL